MPNKRTRPVNIRVSEDEFEKLRDACEKAGTRNVSEFAREALRLILDEQQSAAAIGRDALGRLDELAGRLTNLQAEVERLKTLLRPNG